MMGGDGMLHETNEKNIQPLLKKLINHSPSLLDVGSGLCINLDQFQCNLILALEIHRPYLQKRKVNKPHIIPINADALQMNSLFLPKTISTVSLIDSIEHFTKDDGLKLLKMAEKIANKRVVIFTPRGFFPQKGFDLYQLDGEKFQEHRSGWEVKELLKLGYEVTLFKGLHGPNNPSFVKSFGAKHPPKDAILAWKNMK